MTPALAIVVAYGRADLLDGCLSALGTHRPAIVVDNSASDAIRAVAVAHDVAYVAAPKNLGFAAGVNLGLAEAWRGAEDVLLLNPDALITAEQVASLQAALHAPGSRHAAVGPLLARPDGTSEPAQWPMPSPAQAWLDAFGLSSRHRGLQFVTGAALMLNGAALTEIGGFDERYFLYAEETDWQMRALRAGWTVGVDPTATVTHVGGASSSDAAQRAELFHASGRIFAERWYPGSGARWMRCARIVAALRRMITQPESRAEQRVLLRISLTSGRRWQR